MAIYRNDKTGKYEYRTYITNEFGKRVQKEKTGFASEREAKKAEEQLQFENKLYLMKLENEKKQRQAGKVMSFKEVYEEYIKYKKLTLKPDSLRALKSRIECHIMNYFNKFDNVADILPMDIVNWQIEIDKKGFKLKYKNSLYGALSTMLNFAKDILKVIKDNPASEVGRFKSRGEISTSMQFWTYEEYQKFIKEVDKPVFKILFETLYFTGMRLGECLALNWTDLSNSYISINKTISKEKVNGERIITTPKTKSSIRKVKLSKVLNDNLLLYKKECSKIINFTEKTFIFGCHIPLSPTTIDRYMKKYCDRAGIKKIRIHDLRHSHASLLLSNGVPITVVQNRLGHSDSSITLKHYAHLMPNDEDKAINVIDSLIRAS